MSKKFKCEICGDIKRGEGCVLVVPDSCTDIPISCPYLDWQGQIHDKSTKWIEVKDKQTCFEKQTEIPVSDEQEDINTEIQERDFKYKIYKEEDAKDRKRLND
jgi:hypothetical protein